MIPAPRDSGYTKTTDIPLYWCVYGPAGASRLLVLHGGPGAHHDYLLPQMLRLADRHDVLFYDQRGGGRSRSDGGEEITWRTHVADLDRVVGELGVVPLTLVGYSWGGLLALLYAIESFAGRTEHRPERLILIDPAPMNRAFRGQLEAELARRQEIPAIAERRHALVESDLRERDPNAYRDRAFELSVAGYFADPAAAK